MPLVQKTRQLILSGPWEPLGELDLFSLNEQNAKSAISCNTGLEIVASLVSIPGGWLSFYAFRKHVLSLVPPLHA